MVDLNSASIDQLQTLPSIDLRAAYDLLLWRPYLTWEEVAFVPGFDPARAETLRAAGACVGLPPEPRRAPETPVRGL
jgi:DNA uptake protein ComE-like DNA-binding protein